MGTVAAHLWPVNRPNFQFPRIQPRKAAFSGSWANRCIRQLASSSAILLITITGSNCICRRLLSPPWRLTPNVNPGHVRRSVKHLEQLDRSGSWNRIEWNARGWEVFGELKACYQTSVCLHAYQRRARSANLINMLVICAKLHFPFNRVRVNGS